METQEQFEINQGFQDIKVIKSEDSWGNMLKITNLKLDQKFWESDHYFFDGKSKNYDLFNMGISEIQFINCEIDAQITFQQFTSYAIEKIKIIGCKLDLDSVKRLFIVRSTSLKELDFSNNNLDAKNFEEFQDAFDFFFDYGFKNIKINISYNPIAQKINQNFINSNFSLKIANEVICN